MWTETICGKTWEAGVDNVTILSIHVCSRFQFLLFIITVCIMLQGDSNWNLLLLFTMLVDYRGGHCVCMHVGFLFYAYLKCLRGREVQLPLQWGGGVDIDIRLLVNLRGSLKSIALHCKVVPR